MSSFSLHGCKHPEQPEVELPDTTATEAAIQDSLRITASGTSEVRTLDILVYKGAPLLTLESHVHLDEVHDPLPVSVAVSDSSARTVVALANLPGRLNDSSIAHFDALSQLTMKLEEDDPKQPFMSGITEFSGITEGIGDCSVVMTPLLSLVVIQSVTNMNDDDTLLENPRVHLSGMSTRAPLMKQYGFSISEPADGPVVKLPCDIGLYTQHPGTRLWCYPADMPLTAGEQPMYLILEYEKSDREGTLGHFSVAYEIPSISRNDAVLLDISAR